MKSILFQLAYQAASTVLSLVYANKYQVGKKQHDLGRKQHVNKNVQSGKVMIRIPCRIKNSFYSKS